MNEQASRTVPTPLKVIAWMWILSAFVVAVMEVAGVLMYRMLQQLDDPRIGVPPNIMGIATSATQFGWIDVLQIVLAVVALWGGIELLRLKDRARKLIEAVTWLTLLYTLVRGVQLIHEWKAAARELGADSSMQLDPNTLLSVGTATIAVLTLVFAAPLVMIIRYLRGAEARAATAPPAAKKPSRRSSRPSPSA